MVKCMFITCNTKQSIIGYCKHCNKNFCRIHRLIETHNCTEMLNVIALKKELLHKKLKHESDVSKKKIVFH
jgi:predicted nucleic acid binding AN1-type Zn finger protein